MISDDFFFFLVLYLDMGSDRKSPPESEPRLNPESAAMLPPPLADETEDPLLAPPRSDVEKSATAKEETNVGRASVVGCVRPSFCSLRKTVSYEGMVTVR